MIIFMFAVEETT